MALTLQATVHSDVLHIPDDIIDVWWTALIGKCLTLLATSLEGIFSNDTKPLSLGKVRTLVMNAVSE